ncbi:MAG TPA: DUF5700 domain-containing putative Zn-dependent protease [Gemmatimonadaceae bacterium]|nr:DUF5700 domain-containing putative Zn-dependent protease [Gemmatimonadaceae bacterium]
MLIRVLILSIWLALSACASSQQRPTSTADSRVDVQLVDDEAVAALAILETELARRPVTEAQWNRLYSAEGYVRLRQRESYMKRDFTDADFKAFLESDTLIRRTEALRKTLSGIQRVDVSNAAAQALSYLPRNARIVAHLYPEIKPKTNSFVFSLDTIPGIFLYVDPLQSQAEFQNTLTHELHHIGLNSACGTAHDSSLEEPLRTLVVRMGGFGEGLAMLAAAGSADRNAHYESDSATRNRWNRDVANHEANLRLLERFFLDVVEGRVTSPDSVNTLAGTFYGEQGPWYTVGWKMAVVIEKTFGREKLIGVMCDPRALLKLYNDAVPAWNAKYGERLPLWSERLIQELSR